MARRRMVQATILLDRAREKPWELSILAEVKVREYTRRNWDKPVRFKSLMDLGAYMISYPEGGTP